MKKPAAKAASVRPVVKLDRVCGAGTVRCTCTWNGRILVFSPTCAIANHAAAASGGW